MIFTVVLPSGNEVYSKFSHGKGVREGRVSHLTSRDGQENSAETFRRYISRYVELTTW